MAISKGTSSLAYALFSNQPKDAESYEKELSRLAAKIALRQQNLARANIRLRRAKGAVTLYCSVIYTVYSSIVIFGVKDRHWIHLFALIFGPLGIWALRWIIQSWYTWVKNSNQEYIKELEIQHKELIEELKQKTNFYSTQALLDRYDTEKSKKDQKETVQGQPGQRDQPSQGQPGAQSQPSQEQSGSPNLKSNQLRTQQSNPELAQSTTSGHPPSGLSPSSVLPLQPFVLYTPRWYDRILDILVGEDEQSPKNRQALICANCFNHNGLAQYGESAQTVVYICPRCGFKNGLDAKHKHEIKGEVKDETKDKPNDEIEEKTKDESKEKLAERQSSKEMDPDKETKVPIKDKNGSEKDTEQLDSRADTSD